MDVAALVGVLPTLGPLGILLLLLGYVGKQWLSSDSRYRSEIEKLQNDVARLREDLEQVRKELEAERQKRFDAEEEAHQARLGKAKRSEDDHET